MGQALDEKTQKLAEMLARLRDALQSFQPAVNAMDEFLSYLGKSMEPVNYDEEKITWIQKTGSRGVFELADPKTEGAKPDFKALLSDLKAHNGKFQHRGKFYWIFMDSASIGRKPASKQ